MRARELVRNTTRYIASVQQPGGAIPWFDGGILDPWDHVEAAMGLSIGGEWDSAAAAYRWLARQQRPDGSWLAAYRDDAVMDATRAESNFVAYVATGVWHHYRISGDRHLLAELWPTVRAALDFVVDLQSPAGEIYWALDTRTGINKDALVTGCSSIHRSLGCGLACARELGEAAPHWQRARDRLGAVLRNAPERFDRTWESKDRYSMDWFYPVLGGVLTGDAAKARLRARWDTFVESGHGCRCVADQSWVTVAETAELALACAAVGQHGAGLRLLADLGRLQAEDGSWWTGYALHDRVVWPEERPTWTAGAVLLAADALFGLTAAEDHFTDPEPLAAVGGTRTSRLAVR